MPAFTVQLDQLWETYWVRAPNRDMKRLKATLQIIPTFVLIAHKTAICHNLHTVRPIEISALLDSWVISTPSLKMVCSQKIVSPYILVKTWHTYRSNFFCLVSNGVPVGHEKFLFHCVMYH